ncbi:MAG: UDP-N-acetylmuramate--L-alanine ligase [Actinobacteria bacterium HGW-Actinobacteria-7]|jgi:UDP-N-acetylmuramate--alanine ligase|nr:MAG: UDP-N-acetylmuramate--L-alanine ligase [Actinobacteria bacterium HGW-Actinobacteria-7]
MSGIALVLNARGIAITGSDLRESRYSRALVEAGVPVRIGHDADHLGDPEVVVVSTAIPERNPELTEARRRGIEVWPRAKMLANLAENRMTVAVAGTHGKTSTSSMIATMLSRMELDPTFLIGGEVDGFDTNAANGSGRHFVVEADESDGSFVYLTPDVAVVTNIEADHLDHYGSLAEIERTFAEFMARTPDDGVLVVCGDDARLVELARESGRAVLTYGFAPSCDVRCAAGRRLGEGHEFTVELEDGSVIACATSIPGLHMVSNSAAALATAYALQLDLGRAATALATFSGVRRRFDHIGSAAGVTVVDDYAHHPTEVRATLKAAAELDFSRVWAVFQPHRYSRTAAFSADFGDSFEHADRVVLMDVYSAGEAPIPGVTGKTLLDSTLRRRPRTRAAYLPHRADIVPYLLSVVHSGDLVMTMGAGDVTTLGPELLDALNDKIGQVSP